MRPAVRSARRARGASAGGRFPPGPGLGPVRLANAWWLLTRRPPPSGPSPRSRPVPRPTQCHRPEATPAPGLRSRPCPSALTALSLVWPRSLGPLCSIRIGPASSPGAARPPGTPTRPRSLPPHPALLSAGPADPAAWPCPVSRSRAGQGLCPASCLSARAGSRRGVTAGQLWRAGRTHSSSWSSVAPSHPVLLPAARRVRDPHSPPPTMTLRELRGPLKANDAVFEIFIDWPIDY